MTNHITKGN